LDAARGARYSAVMSDRLFYALVAVAAVALIATAVMWPQRPGRSPGNLSSVAEASQ